MIKLPSRPPFILGGENKDTSRQITTVTDEEVVHFLSVPTRIADSLRAAQESRLKPQPQPLEPGPMVLWWTRCKISKLKRTPARFKGCCSRVLNTVGPPLATDLAFIGAVTNMYTWNTAALEQLAQCLRQLAVTTASAVRGSRHSSERCAGIGQPCKRLSLNRSFDNI